MGTIKSWILGFVKSEILSNLGAIGGLVTPQLVSLLTTKAKLPADQAAALAADVVSVLSTEITNLVNKM